jgi:uncharacterized damage-inducible protein DinB
MSPEEIRTLFDYNTWANHRSLEAAAALTEEQFTRSLGSSFSSVRDTLAHICGGEWVWLERFLGRTPTAMPGVKQFATVPALREHWLAQEQALLAFVNGLTQEDLDRAMEYQTMNFGTYRNPLCHSLQHLANHGTYHRGQVTTMLRQLGAQPMLTDLMHFYRERATRASAA